jgi:SAM-dependent methyltransferase
MLLQDTVSIPRAPAAGFRAPAAPALPNSLADAFASLGIENSDVWAWANYKRVVRDLAAHFVAHKLVEIGGGRDPLFDRTEIDALGAEMTVNDISAIELAALPGGYRTACFDVAGDISGVAHLRNSFDFAFSRMVFEHVADGQRAWANLYELLAPGGVGLAFVPTLYSVPFVLNRLLPDKLAASIVKLIFHHRTDNEDPIFPARYSWCVANPARLRPMLTEIGYRDVIVEPFYGHGYYRYFPVIRDLHRRFTGAARRGDWRTLASFAFIAARK